MRVASIGAISFDIDGTLLDFEGVMAEALGLLRDAIVERAGAARSDLSVMHLRQARDEVAAERSGPRATMEEIRKESVRRVLAGFGCSDPDLTNEMFTVYMQHRFQAIRPYPEVRAVLERLRSRFVLGVVSNGNSYPAACGLEGLFSFEVFSQDCGFEKPDSRIFERAIQEARFRGDEIIHVGDSLRDDVEGAQSAGLSSIWLRRGARDSTVSVAKYPVCRNLVELERLLIESD